MSGFEFVVAEREGQRSLVLRDAQHEFVFKAVAARAARPDAPRLQATPQR